MVRVLKHPIVVWSLVILFSLGLGIWFLGGLIIADFVNNSKSLGSNYAETVRNGNLIGASWGVALACSLGFTIYYLDKFGLKHHKNISQSKVFGSSKLLKDNEINHLTKLQKWGGKYASGWVVKTAIKKKQINFNITPASHALVVGSTGSGKTENVVLPNIVYNLQASDKPSMVVADPKAILYPRLKKVILVAKYNVIKLDFNEFKGNRWNPFMKIKSAWNKGNTGQAERLIDILINSIVPKPQGRTDPFWSQSAKRLIKGVILALLVRDKLEDKTDHLIKPRDLIFHISLPADKLKKWLSKYAKSSVQLASTVNSLIQENERTFSSIVNNCVSDLAILNNEAFNNMTKGNDVNFKSLRSKPTIIFIKTKTGDSTYHFLATLFLNMLNKELLAKHHIQHQRKILFILDEFGSIPTIDHFKEIISNAREYNFWYLMIVQYYKQIDSKYGDREGIVSNCDLRYYLGTNDILTAKAISEEYGTKTVRVGSTSTSKSGSNKHSGQSQHDIARPLIDPYELTKLKDNKMIVKLKTFDPFMVKTCSYWEMEGVANE